MVRTDIDLESQSRAIVLNRLELESIATSSINIAGHTSRCKMGLGNATVIDLETQGGNS